MGYAATMLMIVFLYTMLQSNKEGVLFRLSMTDELTTLFNRSAHEEVINDIRLHGMKDNLVYFNLDLNGLKVANDSFGHEASDELIMGAADCIKSVFSTYGDVYRIGGDEFAVIAYMNDE